MWTLKDEQEEPNLDQSKQEEEEQAPGPGLMVTDCTAGISIQQTNLMSQLCILPTQHNFWKSSS